MTKSLNREKSRKLLLKHNINDDDENKISEISENLSETPAMIYRRSRCLVSSRICRKRAGTINILINLKQPVSLFSSGLTFSSASTNPANSFCSRLGLARLRGWVCSGGGWSRLVWAAMTGPPPPLFR